MLPNKKYGLAGFLVALVSVLAVLFLANPKSYVVTDDEVENRSSSKVVQIDPPSEVAEAPSPVNDDDPGAWKKKTGKVKITQNTLLLL